MGVSINFFIKIKWLLKNIPGEQPGRLPVSGKKNV
jgi:hypothetical protein